MIDLVKVIILGIVEGVTEFLPISSTGHLIVATAILDFHQMQNTFEIFIQLGAVFAVLWYYRSQLLDQVRTVTGDRGVQRLWLNIIIAFVPAGLVGFFFKDDIQAALFNPTTVAISLIVGGFIFLFVERRPTRPAASQVHELTAVSPLQALGIGVAQITSLIPGVSRSGSSIVGGMLTGLNREVATQFSFYLALPTLGIATVYELVTSLDELNTNDLLLLIVGAVVSFIVAWASIGWLLRYVSRNTFIPFGYYRILAGIVILALVAMQVIA